MAAQYDVNLEKCALLKCLCGSAFAAGQAPVRSLALTSPSEPYRERVATTEFQNAWSSRDSRRLQIVPGSALAGNSNCKNRVTELRFLVISRQ